MRRRAGARVPLAALLWPGSAAAVQGSRFRPAVSGKGRRGGHRVAGGVARRAARSSSAAATRSTRRSRPSSPSAWRGRSPAASAAAASWSTAARRAGAGAGLPRDGAGRDPGRPVRRRPAGQEVHRPHHRRGARHGRRHGRGAARATARCALPRRSRPPSASPAPAWRVPTSLSGSMTQNADRLRALPGRRGAVPQARRLRLPAPERLAAARTWPRPCAASCAAARGRSTAARSPRSSPTCAPRRPTADPGLLTIDGLRRLPGATGAPP